MSGYEARHGRTVHYQPRHRTPPRTRKVLAGAGTGITSAALIGSTSAFGFAAPAAAAANAGKAGPAYTSPHLLDAHPNFAAATPLSYTVGEGDTLSAIAQREYGSASLWPALWYVNRDAVHNPNIIDKGQRLTLSSWHPDTATLRAQALAAIPKPPVVHVALAASSTPAPPPTGAYGHPNYCGDGDGDGYDVACPAVQPAQPVQAAASVQAAAPVQASYSGAPGSYQACVITRESGGNSQIWNASGHYGLYQFAAGTWAAAGGNPASFGHASVAEQNQVFATAYAKWGTQPWSPSDGC